MKKLLLAFLMLGMFPMGVCAGVFSGTAEYSGSSEFSQVKAQALWQFGLNWTVGLEGKYADEDAFENPVYAAKLPLLFDSELMSFSVTPFYYFKNKNNNKTQEYQAFGVSTKLVMTLEDDAVDELYSHAYIGAAFSRQKGTASWDTGKITDQYYSQAAYTLGLHKNFFRAFSFEAMGTVAQYPDGITGLNAFTGILDQQDLVPLQTHELVHQLPKYTAAARITRLWADRRATLYLSYRFGEFYTSDPEHSAIVGNTFALTNNVQCNLAYNHLRTVHNKNKRDIFFAQLQFLF